ncbi:NusG domain II-containing protein [Fonticella tunisiensis]|uniref:Uncharacterized protein n=1 Tax=Fonticella tunisiensis TaxID=1096341 RepID=A0A4R7KMH3_9CLOT|nr:NusG domain II-containing protein [Fonticella tunisiensis]TDT57297.1 hypothetical protein EDD71_11279 [Fonticella tunisiensis]
MKLWDKLIIVTVVFGIIGGFIYNYFVFSNKIGNTAVIFVDNNIVKKISINSENKVYDFKFKDQIGYVEVKDGAIRMLEMDKRICPEGICSDTGWISKSYQSIVCLPNKIMVIIEGQENEELDAIVS